MRSLLAAGREVVVRSSSSGASSFYSIVHYTDASLTCWGAHLLNLTAASVLSQEVILALNTFLDQVSMESVILMSDKATIVTYLRKQGGTVSRVMCNLVHEVVLWTKVHSGEEKQF